MAVNLIGSLPPSNANVDLGRYVVLAEQAALSIIAFQKESVASGWLLGYTGEVSRNEANTVLTLVVPQLDNRPGSRVSCTFTHTRAALHKQQGASQGCFAKYH